METIRKVRLAHFRDGKRIREITRDFNLSRNTVRSIIRTGIIDQKSRFLPPRPFWEQPNVLITPHSSAISQEYIDLFIQEWLETLREI